MLPTRSRAPACSSGAAADAAGVGDVPEDCGGVVDEPERARRLHVRAGGTRRVCRREDEHRRALVRLANRVDDRAPGPREIDVHDVELRFQLRVLGGKEPLDLQRVGAAEAPAAILREVGIQPLVPGSRERA